MSWVLRGSCLDLVSYVKTRLCMYGRGPYVFLHGGGCSDWAFAMKEEGFVVPWVVHARF